MMYYSLTSHQHVLAATVIFSVVLILQE